MKPVQKGVDYKPDCGRSRKDTGMAPKRMVDRASQSGPSH